MNVAVYGGSFDPPHVAHVLTASHLLENGDFERVLVVPVYEHAFHKPLAPFEHRVAMCTLCFAGTNGVSVSDVEKALPRPSYTVRTLERIAQDHPDWSLRFVMGSDALGETDKWRDYERVQALAPPFVVTRVGHERPGLGPAVLPDVSSTRVRELLSRGPNDPAARRELEMLVPSAVIAYVDEHGLYRSGAGRES
jgi:nicotinate-nucleotide adenylyltransferase